MRMQPQHGHCNQSYQFDIPRVIILIIMTCVADSPTMEDQAPPECFRHSLQLRLIKLIFCFNNSNVIIIIQLYLPISVASCLQATELNRPMANV
ncbi:hypothetical protein V1478_010227 [Vespula squamosa]|uniref:Uncharacterized protein n=1 Tax=Vespula squamosa TaxID=30214 RepID=A0ABD2AJT2_VESSQ